VQEAGTLDQVSVLAQRLRHLTAQTIRDVGRIARGLRPSTLDDLGLVPALQRYADEISAAAVSQSPSATMALGDCLQKLRQRCTASSRRR